jgi:hypothetical protein
MGPTYDDITKHKRRRTGDQMDKLDAARKLAAAVFGGDDPRDQELAYSIAKTVSGEAEIGRFVATFSIDEQLIRVTVEEG